MDNIVVEYRLTVKGEGVKSGDHFYRFVDELASAATIGSEGNELQGLGAEAKDNLLKYRGVVTVKEYQEERKSGVFSLELPVENFDLTRFDPTLLLGVIAGDMLGHPEIADVRILAVDTPTSFKKHIKGPRVGRDGVRGAFNLDKRPLLAFTVKPRLGLTAQDHAAICYAALKGGVDLAEDDERLVNPMYCPANERVRRCVEAAAKAEHDTGERKMYSTNLTVREDRIVATFEELDAAARQVNGRGLECVKIDVPPVSVGGLLSLTEYLHEKKRDVIVTVYPELYWFYRKLFPASWFLRLLRWCGADILYAGTPVILEHFGEKGRTPSIVTARLAEVKHDLYERTLWAAESGVDIRQSMPTVTGRVYPVTLDLLYTFLGGKVGFFIGSGILKHRGGIEAGARLCRAALDVAVSRKRYSQVLKDKDTKYDKELFGSDYVDPKEVLRQDPELRRLVEVPVD